METATNQRDRLLTAEEFALLPEPDQPCELVRGRIVRMSPAQSLHGYVCTRLGYWLESFRVQHDTGRILSHDVGIVTGRDPDSVRGADFAFVSYDRLPRGPLPRGFLAVAPEVVFEVLSLGNRSEEMARKLAEYFAAGVLVAVVLHPERRTASVHRQDGDPQVFHEGDTLLIPELDERFALPLGRVLAD